MTAGLATGRADGWPRCDYVEVEYAARGGGRERRPLAACWHLRFEWMSPVRGFPSFRGQRNWPGWWWFSRTGTHVGAESGETSGRLWLRAASQAGRSARPPCGIMSR
jgi:hypothetical protein